MRERDNTKDVIYIQHAGRIYEMSIEKLIIDAFRVADDVEVKKTDFNKYKVEKRGE